MGQRCFLFLSFGTVWDAGGASQPFFFGKEDRLLIQKIKAKTIFNIKKFSIGDLKCIKRNID